MKSKPKPILTTVLIAISALFIFLYTKQESSLRTESENWLSIEAVISESNIRRDWNKNTGTPNAIYQFELQYIYEVNNTSFTGSRYSFHGDSSFKSKSIVDQLLVKYPVGKRITIYYQPENPQESVVLR